MKEPVDLKRYMGTWKQVSVKPVPWFQKDCKDVKAIYKLRDDGKVDVVNVCDGRERHGVARSVSKDNRHLEVSFFPLIWGDYDIAEIDKDYTKVTVKSKNYTWKLRKCKTKKC